MRDVASRAIGIWMQSQSISVGPGFSSAGLGIKLFITSRVIAYRIIYCFVTVNLLMLLLVLKLYCDGKTPSCGELF